MPTHYQFVCPLPNGFHARPASILAEHANRFDSAVIIIHEAAGGRQSEYADLKSVLSVVALDIHFSVPCQISAEGSDEIECIDALKVLIETTLREADEDDVVQTDEPKARETQLPVILRQLDVSYTSGRSVSRGAGIGIAVHVGGFGLSEEALRAKADDPDKELELVRRAIQAVCTLLNERAHRASTDTETALLNAHLQMVQDPALWASIVEIVEGGSTAPQAVVSAASRFMDTLRKASSAYIRDRAVDVQDIAMLILDELMPDQTNASQITLVEDSLIFADVLTANQLMGMDRALLKGLVLGAVGATSHTVILARSFGVPTLIDVEGVCGIAALGDRTVVDADGGFVVSPITTEIEAFYHHQEVLEKRRIERLLPLVSGPVTTHDGCAIEVGANAADPLDVESAISNGADGIGLFRTEFLFLDRDTPPDEDEQLDVYTRAIQAAHGRPLIFRTFDIGGDKPAPYMQIGAEENPFLGCRGLRLYERTLDVFDSQIRALLRAASSAPIGSVKLMAPMVSTPSEAKWFRDRVRSMEQELVRAKIQCALDTPVGVMIEVPAIALVIDVLCEHVDFVSIGTNDLCQYWMAADRGNQSVSGLCDPHHPSFLRLLRLIVREAKANGLWVGVCGEMGGRIQDLPLLLGLGLNEISGSPNAVMELKLAVRDADSTKCKAILDAACRCTAPEEVVGLLDNAVWKASSSQTLPIIDRGCIQIGSDARTKAYAINEAVDLLTINGRTNQPQAVEEAIWAREASYSTGLGYGFAIPHCKCEAVTAPTLTVLKLDQPVEWGSMDGEPVRVVLLLAVPSDEHSGGGAQGHMKIFAKLARKLMHEEFRNTVREMTDPGLIEEYLRTELLIEPV